MVQVQCLERLELQKKTREMQDMKARNSEPVPILAAAAHQPASREHMVDATEAEEHQAAATPVVIQRRASTLRGRVYAQMRPGKSRQWQT